MSIENVLIVGSTSLLGQSLAHHYAKQGYRLILAGPDLNEIEIVAKDLMFRYKCSVESLYFDANDPDLCASLPEQLVLEYGCPKLMLFVLGYIGKTEGNHVNRQETAKITAINYSNVVLFLTGLLPEIEQHSNRSIVFVSSVAGDRGRKTNFVYGAAKAALNTYAQGLRALLLSKNSRVITIKLGYMDTRSAYGKTPAFMTCSSDYAARKIIQAIEKKRHIVYVPGFWRVIMAMLRILPESIFIRLPLP